MRVFVYFNLHRKLWSIKALEGPMRGRVVHHTDRLQLNRCTFKVSEAGRQRVILEKRKNVHAGVVGTWFEGEPLDTLPEAGAVTYNPYKAPTFTRKATGEAVHTADAVTFDGRTVLAVAA